MFLHVWEQSIIKVQIAQLWLCINLIWPKIVHCAFKRDHKFKRCIVFVTINFPEHFKIFEIKLYKWGSYNIQLSNQTKATCWNPPDVCISLKSDQIHTEYYNTWIESFLKGHLFACKMYIMISHLWCSSNALETQESGFTHCFSYSLKRDFRYTLWMTKQPFEGHVVSHMLAM